MSKIKTLTPALLKRLIAEERSKLFKETSDPVVAGVEEAEDVSAEEVEASEYAGSLEKDIDHLKALKIAEARLRRIAKQVSRKKKLVSGRIIKSL